MKTGKAWEELKRWLTDMEDLEMFATITLAKIDELEMKHNESSNV